MRTLGMRRVAEREARELSPRVAALATAYVTGINAGIDSARALPVEFQLLRLEPEPWNTVDLLAAGKLMGFGLSTNWEMELLRARHRAARRARTGCPARAAVSAWQSDRREAGRRRTPARRSDLAEQIARVRDVLGLGMHATGSNNWVVSGERSVTGKPLLACDPHLTFTAPDLWYEADLVCDDYRVRGATLPTNPFPVFGQTEHVAYGFTNVMADTQDLFVERLNADDARMYEFEGGWREAEVVREEIQVKGRSVTEAIDVTVTHHGPIVSDVLGADEPLALSWTGLQYPLLTESGYDMARARNGEELLQAAATHHVPPLNLLWADREGNIGYQLAGRIPLRKGGTPDLPKPGLDRRVRVGRHDSLRGPPAGREPARRVPRHRQQPHRRRRLSAPHHLGVDDRLPGAADRGDAGRARAPLRRPTSSACSTTSSRCPGSRPCTGCPACTPPASARPARSSGSRAGTVCCHPTPSRPPSCTPSRSCSRR